MPERPYSLTSSELEELFEQLELEPRSIAKAVVDELTARGFVANACPGAGQDLTIEQASKFLGEGRTKIFERIRNRELVGYRLGRRTMITSESAERLRNLIIEEGRRKLEAEQAARAARQLRRGRDK